MQSHANAGGAVSRPAADSSLSPMQAAARLNAERHLVQRVFEACGEAIEEACRHSATPAEFLVALPANESGGRADATRFEPRVYRHLQAVAQGERQTFGSLTAAALDAEAAELLPPDDARLHARYLTEGFGNRHGEEIRNCPDEVLRQLATSWGYTQIMGYHMVGREGTVRDLLDVKFHFYLAVQLLSEFAADYHLDTARRISGRFSGIDPVTDQSMGGAMVLTVTAQYLTLTVEVGDLVYFSHPLTPNLRTGRRGIFKQLFEVIDKQPDYSRGTMTYKLLDTSWLSSKILSRIAPAGTLAWGSATSADRNRYMFLSSSATGTYSDVTAGKAVW